jgi:hypothetical protein
MSDPVFKAKINVGDVLVGRGKVRAGVFVAPGPDHTFQRCGELTLTALEAATLKELLQSPEEDDYEYAVQGENLYRGGTYISPWFRSRAWAEGYLEEAKELPTFFGPLKEEYGKFKIVKRKKAGEVEDAT